MLAITARAAKCTNLPRLARCISVDAATSSSTLPVVAQPVARPVHVSLTAPFKRHPSDQTSAAEDVVVLDPTVFNHPIRRDILHLCVNHYRDSLRQGSGSTKTRGEVVGSGRKIQRQKGTGRARVGDAQSPIRRGGGVAFGPKPRDFSTKLPRKVVQMGMRVALSTKVKEQRFAVMHTFHWPSAKTRNLSLRIKDLGLKHTLFITGENELPKDVMLAMRNIPGVSFTTAAELNVYDILRWSRIVLDAKAVDFFETTLKKDSPYLDLVEEVATPA